MQKGSYIDQESQKEFEVRGVKNVNSRKFDVIDVDSPTKGSMISLLGCGIRMMLRFPVYAYFLSFLIMLLSTLSFSLAMASCGEMVGTEEDSRRETIEIKGNWFHETKLFVSFRLKTAIC